MIDTMMNGWNVVHEVSGEHSLWKPNRKPGLSRGGFFDECDQMIDHEQDLFNRTLDIIKRGQLKFYCSAPTRLIPDLKILYFRLTNEFLEDEKINIQDNENKQSVSIKTTLFIPNIYDEYFNEYMKEKPIPFGNQFQRDIGYTDKLISKWFVRNTKFAFYLFKMLGVRI